MYSTKILQRFQEFRTSRSFCDIAIVTSGIEVFAHKVLLAAASDYFRALFTTSLHDGDSVTEANVIGITDEALETCLKYIYNEDVHICEDSLDEVLHASSYLQIWDLKDKCVLFMKNSLNVKNCLHFLNLSKIFACPDMEHICWDFLEQNTNDVLYVANVSEVISTNTMQKVLSSDKLSIENEEILFQTFLFWMKNKPHESMICNIFKLIRLPTLDEVYIQTKVLSEDAISKCTSCSAYAKQSLEFVKNNVSQLTAKLSNTQVEARGSRTVVITSRDLKTVQICNVGKKLWKNIELPPLPIISDCSSVVTADRKLFLMGGLQSKRCFSLQLNDNEQEWNELPEMSQLHNFSGWSGTVLSRDKIFVIGGREGRSYLSTVEAFDLRKEEWSGVPNMNKSRANMAIATNNEHIFVLGGKNTTKILSDVEVLNFTNNEWKNLPAMKEPRLGATAVVCKSKLYVLGGWNRCVLSSCEMLEFESGSWVSIECLNYQRYFFGSCVIANKIFVFGGCQNTDELSNCEIFDINKTSWEPFHIDILSKSFCKVGNF